jgi:hypothetical protein
MTIPDWISLTEWLGGVLASLVGLLFGAIWYVRKEGRQEKKEVEEHVSDVSNSISQVENKLASMIGRQDMDIIKIKEKHDIDVNRIDAEFGNFRVDIAGKLFTRQDAEALRRDMMAMFAPVQADVKQLQSSFDKDMGSLKGQLNALSNALLKAER